MTSPATNNELSTPLLSNIPQHESDADAYDEECCMLCSLKINVGDVKEEESDDDSSQCTSWFNNFVSLIVLEDELVVDSDDSSQFALLCDNLFPLVVLPALLFLSFGEAFYTSSIYADSDLRWSTVNYSIALLVTIAILYRHVVHDCKITCSVAPFLPEILMDIVLGLVLSGMVVPAFFLLLISILCLAGCVVTSSISGLVDVPNASTLIHQRRL